MEEIVQRRNMLIAEPIA